MSPRTIPGVRVCEICGSLLKGYQLRFCSVPHSLQWLHGHKPSRHKAGRVLSAMMAAGEIPKPPRARGPFKYSPEMREAIHLVKTGSKVADLTPEQRELFRQYNRERSRLMREKRARKEGSIGSLPNRAS